MVAATDLDELKRALERLQESNEALSRENKILREENAVLKRGLFGRRSERIEPGQLSFLEPGADELPEPSTEERPAKREGKAKKRGHGRAPFPPHLPRETIELDVDEADRVCPECSAEMRSIGEDVTERGHIVPAQVVVRRYVRHKYACPAGHAVRTAPAPPGVVDGAKYEPSVYAYIATSKYSDHLPLHRLEGILKRRELYVPKQTMWDMLVRIDELVAQPVLEQMRQELLEEDALHADETPVRMRVEDGKGSRWTYVWNWRNLRGSGPAKSLIRFEIGRSRDGPMRFLGDWSGTLITDGYEVYDAVARRNDIVRAGCWAHARRKLKDAFEAGTKRAAVLLAPIQRLFWIERAIVRRAERDGLDFDGLVRLREQVRSRRAASVLDRIFALASEIERDRKVLPKSNLGKAAGYLLNQRKPLSRIMENGRLPIHNNDSERDLRHVAVGRKNWMIFASRRGGEVACRLYSLVLSAKQAGIDVEAYLEDLLGRIDTTPASDIASLTPWAWAESRRAAAEA